MPESGDMPMGILPPALPSHVWCLPEVILMVVVVMCLLPLNGFKLVSPVVSSMCPMPRRGHLFPLSDLEDAMMVEKESRGGSEKDLAGVPDLEASPCPTRCVGDHRGDGACKKSDRRFRICQLGMNLSTPNEELRRLPKHASFRGWRKGSRWAVLSFSPVIFLAERRPHGARASVATLAHLLPPGFQTKWEAVLQWLRDRPFLSQLQLGMARRRSECPKWFALGGVQIVSKLRQQIGPNCNLCSPIRVLLAKSRDCTVFFLLLCPCVWFILSLFYIYT